MGEIVQLKRPLPKEEITLLTDIDKESRVIEITKYLTGMITSNRSNNNYQPHTGDEDQVLREEAFQLRVELGIIKPDGKVNRPPSDQMPEPNVKDQIQSSEPSFA